MTRRTVNILLAIALVGVIALTWSVRRDFALRNAQFLPGMVDAVAYDAQSANPAFADGKTLRDPAPGSAARGFPPLHFRPTPEDAAMAGETLQNPISDTVRAGLQRGAQLYATFCQPCHGAGANGDGLVAQRGFPAPPSLLTTKARGLKDGQLFHILTVGQGNMPSLASQIVRKDRWNVINYVRSIQRSQPQGQDK